MLRPKRGHHRHSKLEWTGVHDKTLFHWLDILIVPVIIAAAAFWLNAQQQQHNTTMTLDQERESLLNTYMDSMSNLLLNDKANLLLNDKLPHGHNSCSTLSDVAWDTAQARTITVMRRLDGPRNGSL